MGTTHSELPWRTDSDTFAYEIHTDEFYPGIESVDGETIVRIGYAEHEDDDGGVRGRSLARGKANADFIVLACNNHYQLTAMLWRFTEIDTDQHTTEAEWSEFHREVAATLAKVSSH